MIGWVEDMYRYVLVGHFEAASPPPMCVDVDKSPFPDNGCLREVFDVHVSTSPLSDLITEYEPIPNECIIVTVFL